MHITYEYRKHLTSLMRMESTRSILKPSSNFVDKRISDLRREEAVILRVCVKTLTVSSSQCHNTIQRRYDRVPSLFHT